MGKQKIVVIGGTGFIGSKISKLLAQAGHDVVAAAPATGVNTVTGDGLAEVLEGADTVVDVSNAMSFDPGEVRRFFEASGHNLTEAARGAGVNHHVVLSIVGVDRMPGNGYFQGKLIQERIAASAGLPYTIVRSTQFFEFLGTIADAYTVEGHVALSGGQFQPIAAEDVALVLAGVATGAPINGIVEIGGPDRGPFDRIVDRYLRARHDSRPMRRNPNADYFGGSVEDLSLVPIGQHRLGAIELDGWLASQATSH